MSRIGRCEHGRLLRHVPEPTASTGATAGRPSGLHPTACHTASLEAPLDRCSRVEGYCSTRPQPIFTGSSTRDAHWPRGYTTAVGTHKSIMGESSVVLHLPPEVSGPPRLMLLHTTTQRQREKLFPLSLWSPKQNSPRSERSAPRVPRDHACGETERPFGVGRFVNYIAITLLCESGLLRMNHNGTRRELSTF